MSLYMIFSCGLRFYVAITPQGKRFVPREEAEAIWHQMHVRKVAV